MNRALALFDKLLALPLEAMISRVAEENADVITALNKEQLDAGRDANGGDLGVYQNFSYKGRFRPVDLKLTGAFRDSFDVEVFGNAFRVVATDEKTPKLTARYGAEILGLSTNNKVRAARLLLPGFIRQIRQKL